MPSAAAIASPAQEFSASEMPEAHFIITPHQSLSDRGALAVYGCLAVFALTLQTVCLVHGLWPIALFIFLDTAGLIFAIHVFRRYQSQRCEEIIVGQQQVSVRRRFRQTVTFDQTFPRFGLRIESEAHEDFGCRHVHLRLRSAKVEIARDLSPSERAQFSAALQKALRPQPMAEAETLRRSA